MTIKTLTANEVADLLRVSKVTIDRWQRRGILVPVIKGGKGHIRRYTEDQITSFLQLKR